MAKTKIDAYKLVSTGGSSGNITPATASARKTLYATNRLGLTVGSIGKIVGDIESIAIATVKDEKQRDILERKRLRREADQAAEDRTELEGLAKKSKKKPKISNSMKTTMKKSPLAKFVEGFLGPIGTFLLQMASWAFLKELLRWASDEESLKKIEVFLHKIHTVFTKLSQFSNWLIGDKFMGGMAKLIGADSTFGERVSGLWDLFQGIVVLKLLFNPFGLLGNIISLLGLFADKFNKWRGKTPKTPKNKTNRKWWQRKVNRSPSQNRFMKSAKRFYKGTANWGDKFRMWRKGQIGLGGIFGKSGTDASGTMAGTKGWRSWLKMPQNTGVGKWANKNWTRWQSGVKDTTTKANNIFQNIGNSKIVQNAKGLFTKPTKLPWWKQAVSKGSNLLTKAGNSPAGKLLGKAKGASGPIVQSLLAGLTLKGRLDKGEEVNKAVVGTAAEVGGAWAGFTAGAGLTGSLVAPMAAVPPWGTAAAGVLTLAGGVGGAFLGQEGMKRVSDTVMDNVNKKNKAWWDPMGAFTGEKTGSGIKPEDKFFGGIVKGISKAVSGVVKGVSSAVSGVVNTVGKIASNPIVGTALSFIPGMQIPMAVINGVGALQQGNIMGALSAGLGGLGAFANINTVNAISQPQWMQNLRFSKFGQGVANMYHSGANAFSALSSGFNNFMGSNIGQIGKGVLQGVTGGGWGGLGGTLAGMTGIGDITGKMGSFAEQWGLGGIGNIIPGLGQTLGNIGLGDLPGMSTLFGGSFNAMGPIGALADRFGLTGIMDAVTGMMASGDMMTGLRQLAPELGVDPAVLGVYDEGRKYFTDGKFNSQLAMQTAIEFIPVPMVLQKLEIAPATVPINSGGGSSGGLSSLLGRLGG